MPHHTLSPQSDPWWRYGYVWLVISGPVTVIIAGLITAWLTLQSPDPVLSRDNDPQIKAIHQMRDQRDHSLTPAVQARNHAAKPGSP